MTTFIVFCTAQIPTETLDKFVAESISARWTPDEPSPWILQRSPSDPVRGPSLGSPVAAFNTGFADATPATLQAFLEEHVKDKESFADFGGEIADLSYVVLDSRSAEDGNCEVHYRYDYIPDDEENEVQEWKVWRVKFRVAWPLLAGLWHSPGDVFSFFENGRDAYTDANGVTQLAWLEQDKSEFPTLNDADRAPYGPGNGEAAV